jgi:uridine kinase
MSKFKHVIKRSGSIVPFNPDRIMNAIYRAVVAVGGRDRERAQWLTSEVVKCLEETLGEDEMPHIETIQDAVEKVLIENGHARVAKAYILYREERARSRREAGAKASRPSENIPWAKLWHILDWAVDHRVNTVRALNERIARGEFPHLVHESEAAYEDDVSTAADLIVERQDRLKLVVISGPSSSGKTTTTIKLEQRLKRLGLRFVTLNVDNYFFDLEIHPKDEFGDYDFETPQALDLALINEHLGRLVDGESVLVPYYDFKEGRRHLDHTSLRVDNDEILLVDSLHGLYPEMTESVPDESKFKLYLEPLLQMKNIQGEFVRWTDLRLMRRMLRDAVHRAYDPQMTLEHWHYVRSSELRNIIPHIQKADYVVNSGMPYELPLFRPRLLEQFAKWVRQYEGDPLREDARRRASRVLQLLESVEPVEDDSPVPADSVLREFIGGSKLQY